MRTGTWISLSAVAALGVLLWTGVVLGQGQTPACPNTPAKVQGQVLKVDPEHGKLTVRGTDGTTHEFQASRETLQDYKVGDRVQANLRSAPDCK